MLKKATLLILQLLLPCLLFAQWNIVSTLNDGVIMDVQMITAQNIAVCGSGVMISNNGGTSWTKSDQFKTLGDGGTLDNLWYSASNFYDVHFVTPQHGFAAGWTLVNTREIIIETTDGGLTWSVAYLGETNPNDPVGITRMQFTSELTGYAGSFLGRIIKTTDGGANWSELSIGVAADIHGIHFLNDASGYVVAGDKLYTTSNGGQSWTSTSLDHQAAGVYFLTSQTGFISTGDKIFKTTDGGSTWTEARMTMYANQFQFTDSQNGFAFGSSIYRTTNGGETWALQQKDDYGFTAVHFIDTNNGTATTSNGKIYKTANGGIGRTPNVTITGFSPAQGLAGTTITINGTNLDYVHTVTIGNQPASFMSSGTEQLMAIVPNNITDDQPISVQTVNGTVTSTQNFKLIKSPYLYSFTPVYGAEGTTVTITGNNLSYATSVLFNNVPASFSIVDNETITTTTPGGNATGKIDIITTYGKATSYETYTKFETPVITSVTPSSGYRDTNITLRGTGFYLGNTVKLNGVTVTAWVKSETEAIVWGLPANATAGKFSLSNAAATGYSPGDFTVVEGSPSTTITGISPATGGYGELVTVSGSDLYSLKSLKLNGVDMVYEILSDNELIAEIPELVESGPIEGTGFNGEIVPNTAPDFTMINGYAIPEITTMTPSSGLIQTEVVLEGRNFYNVNEVYFNGVLSQRAQRQGLTRLVTEVPNFATTGPVTLRNTTTDKIYTVVNNYCVPQAGRNENYFLRFDWLAVGNVLYENTATGQCKSYYNETSKVVEAAKGSDVILYSKLVFCNSNDEYYYPSYYGVFVDWNSDQDFLDDGELVYHSGTQVPDQQHYQTMTIPSAAATGTYRMRVFASSAYWDDLHPCQATNGQGLAVDLTLSVVNTPSSQAPEFTAFQPTTTTYGATLSIEGQHLASTHFVTIDKIRAPFSFNSTTGDLDVTVPSNTSAGDVIIATDGGLLRVRDQLTVVPTPVISQFTPALDTVGGKIIIIVPRASLASITHVYFNGVEAQFTVEFGQQIAAIVPDGSTPGKISVQNEFDTYQSATDFTVIPEVSINSIYPASAHMGESVLINGNKFIAITDVRFNEKSAEFTVISPTQISAKVPYGGSHGHISVVNKKDEVVSADVFTVLSESSNATFREIPAFNYDYLDLNGRFGHVDYDEDGDQDLVVSAVLYTRPTTYDHMAIYRNNGDGTFGITDIRIRGEDIMFGDFNLDGHVDIITSRPGGYDIYYNDATHSFTAPAKEIRFSLDYNYWSDHTFPLLTKVMDFDHDGDLDVMITASSIAWLEQDNGNFTLRYIEIDGQRRGPYLFEDLDLDGDTDIVTQYQVHTNNDGTFVPSYDISYDLWNPVAMSEQPYSLIDYNADGYPDLFGGWFSYYGNNFTLYENKINTFGQTRFADYTVSPITQGWGDFYNTGVPGVLTFASHPDEDPPLSYDKFRIKYFDIPQDGHGVEKESILAHGNPYGIPGSMPTTYFDFENDGDLDMIFIHGFNQVWPRLYKNYTSETTGRVNDAPAAPTILTFEKLSDTAVMLRWNKGTDDYTSTVSLNYNVRVKDETTGNYKMTPFPSGIPYGNAGMATNYYLKGLDPTHDYSFDVQSVDQGYRSSGFSTAATFSLEEPVLPSPSELVSSPVSTRSISFQWKDNSDSEEGFIIEYKKESATDYTILTTVDADVVSFQADMLDCHESYAFRVKAFEGSSISAYSVPTTATTLEVPKPAITGGDSFCKGSGLSITASEGYASYSWSNGSTDATTEITETGTYTVTVTDALGCENSGGQLVVAVGIPTALLQYNGTNLSASGGDAYEWYFEDELQPGTGDTFVPSEPGDYKVKVTKDGCSAFAEVHLSNIIDPDPVTGIESDEHLATQVFPNPTTGKFIIRTEGIDGTLSVLNGLGKEIHSRYLSSSDKELMIDITAEASGLYIVLINGDEHKEAHRVVLVK